MKTIGILAFSNTFDGGVNQYTQSMIDTLKTDKSKKYIIFYKTKICQFNFEGLESRKVHEHSSSTFINLIHFLQLILRIRKPLFFNKSEKDVFSDIDFFLSPTISVYPHFYLNKPFSITIHDMQERYYPNFFSAKRNIIRWAKTSVLAETATKILCESNYVKNDIIKFTNANKEKIYIIQSPVPKSFLDYQTDYDSINQIKKKYNLPDNFIFYPAQCWPHKNHITLLEAFSIVTKKIHNIHLILTGSQQNNYTTVINKIISLNLIKKVHHLGYIDYEDIPALYKLSKMLVMPTLFESVSIPIYEAFSLKIPVCSSNAVALPEQVGDAGLLFHPHNTKDMAEKILMYLENPALAAEKSLKGYEKMKNFNHETYKTKLMNIIDFEN